MLRCMEACLLHTGYYNIPSCKMVSEQLGNCHNPFIAKAIRCDTLKVVMANLHFADNNHSDNDNFFKINFNTA